MNRLINTTSAIYLCLALLAILSFFLAHFFFCLALLCREKYLPCRAFPVHSSWFWHQQVKPQWPTSQPHTTALSGKGVASSQAPHWGSGRHILEFFLAHIEIPGNFYPTLSRWGWMELSQNTASRKSARGEKGNSTWGWMSFKGSPWPERKRPRNQTRGLKGRYGCTRRVIQLIGVGWRDQYNLLRTCQYSIWLMS